MTEREWARGLRGIGIGMPILGAYQLMAAVVHATLDRQPLLFEPVSVPFNSNEGVAIVIMRILTGAMMIAGGIAILRRAAVARPINLALAGLLFIHVIGLPYVLPETFRYWLTPFPWVYLLLLLSFVFAFSRKDWMSLPPSLRKND